MSPIAKRWLPLLFLLLFSLLYWQLPIGGQIVYQPDAPPLVPSWPHLEIHPLPEGGVRIVVQDPTPWVHVRLESGQLPFTITEHGEQTAAGLWQWAWLAPTTPTAPLHLYRDCHTGCQTWAVRHMGTADLLPTPPLTTPTKLGLVLPHPQRNWHNRQGWAVEITYTELAEEPFWGIDDVAQRVQQAHASGLRVLLRVEYAQGQPLPPTGDEVALDRYLRTLRRLGRDVRLSPVYGFIIGGNMNTAAQPITPAWYARLFNGYTAASPHDNALAIVRHENPRTRVLVGPLSPWVDFVSAGAIPYALDVPWLAEFNTLITYLAQGPLPDGFALQAFGWVDAPALATAEAQAREPQLTLHRPEWGTAEAGFGVYRDWLAVINSHPATANLPVYITASNTLGKVDGRTPAENYPTGWLTHALAEVEGNPQVQALCWFMDYFPHDEQWALFSLSDGRAELGSAAEEFEGLLEGGK